MKTLLAVTFVAAFGFTVSAQAMPVAPAPVDGMTTKVAEGCGPGRVRGPGGRCHFRGWRLGCGPGMHRNWRGRCRPN
ncbi:MAG: hypothetical protein JO000_03340 [Alphaproteobacteria bacterium]|nr:hypothetical protein [Alphaproteobacteria bacterium]